MLTMCFTQPHDVVFRDQRYFCEPYPNRWIIRNEQRAIVAHIGVHEKAVEANGERFPIGGIAEVCVHPDYRGRGYVRTMLRCIHAWLAERGFVFSVLFGRPCLYESSGYVQVENLFHGGFPLGERTQVNAMVKELSGKLWPSSEVHLPGPKF